MAQTVFGQGRGERRTEFKPADGNLFLPMARSSDGRGRRRRFPRTDFLSGRKRREQGVIQPNLGFGSSGVQEELHGSNVCELLNSTDPTNPLAELSLIDQLGKKACHSPPAFKAFSFE
ncbi:hypothetical protein KSP40_PGU004379 [Platanthera guangdongensis]|uniref:Uncharacterized protein n=1 Tax=Platanthera guangdongensis TaxID=2320717 RepID=A0ABR2N4P6_9ASPA